MSAPNGMQTQPNGFNSFGNPNALYSMPQISQGMPVLPLPSNNSNQSSTSQQPALSLDSLDMSQVNFSALKDGVPQTTAMKTLPEPPVQAMPGMQNSLAFPSMSASSRPSNAQLYSQYNPMMSQQGQNQMMVHPQANPSYYSGRPATSQSQSQRPQFDQSHPTSQLYFSVAQAAQATQAQRPLQASQGFTTNNEAAWAQCGRCRKWRVVTCPDSSTFRIPSTWTCANNPDRDYNSCEKAQERPSAKRYSPNQLRSLTQNRRQRWQSAMNPAAMQQGQGQGQPQQQQNYRRARPQFSSRVQQPLRPSGYMQSMRVQEEQKKSQVAYSNVMGLLNLHTQDETRKANERARQRREEHERQAEAIRDRANTAQAQKKKLKRDKESDDEYVPEFEAEEGSSDDAADEMDNSDDEGFMPSRSAMAQKNRVLFDRSFMQSTTWSENETNALLQYVQRKGLDDFSEVSNDSILQVRHSNPADCERRVKEVLDHAKQLRNAQQTGGSMYAPNPAVQARPTRRRMYDSEDEEDDEDSPTRVLRSSSRLSRAGRKNYNEVEAIDEYLKMEESQIVPQADLYKEKIDKILDKRTVWVRPTATEESEPVTNIASVEESMRDQYIETVQYLVKLEGESFLHLHWLTRAHMDERFGKPRTKRRVDKFLKNEDEIKNENEVLWGGELFNPLFKEVDRIIDAMIVAGEEKYFVKWQSMSYSQCTWEKGADIDNEEKIAEFRRFNEIPQDGKPQNFDTPHQIRAQNGWYKNEERHVYKNDNTLRDYQVIGVNWLIKKFYEGKNAILADEMGLGKTIQSTAFIEHLYRFNNILGPFLIVAPLSTVPHWKREVETWTDMNVIVYHDSDGQKGRDVIRRNEFYFRDQGTHMTKFNVMITTYELLQQDLEWLANIKWVMAIIDEGHRLKSKSTKLFQRFSELNCSRRILLTGTPIQNSTSELFNLLHFVEPKEFPSASSFRRNFGTMDVETLQRLQQRIQPYMLRRLKNAVEKSIPKKEEIIIDIHLTTMQKTYYRALYDRNRQFLLGDEGDKHNLPNLINLQVQLRKCCNHPFLIDSIYEKECPEVMPEREYIDKLIQSSGKMVLLDKLLVKLKKEGHRVLIFSQMKRVLDFLSEYLKYRGFLYERFDGGTSSRDRQDGIDRFCAPNSDRFVFLLTTRAGGQGLNLVAADTVIIFDSDWNPQQDIQAQARCHRIGQDKPVSVYRLVTIKTYESGMFEAASMKLGLGHAILKSVEHNGTKKSAQNIADLSTLLKKGAYAIMDDNADAAKLYHEQDIEEILTHSAHKVERNENEEDSKNEPDLSFQFTRQNFVSNEADTSLDVEDEKFWERLFAMQNGEEYEEQEESDASRLLARLTDGSATKSSRTVNEFWKDLERHVDKMLKLKEDGKTIPHMDTNLDIVQLIENKSKFSQGRVHKAKKWLREMQARRRKSRKRTLADNAPMELERPANAKPKRGRKRKRESKQSQPTKRRKQDPMWGADDYPDKLLEHMDQCKICDALGELVLCDGPCVGSYHPSCIGLETVPDGDTWYCDDCQTLYEERVRIDELTQHKSSRFEPKTYRVHVYMDNDTSDSRDVYEYGVYEAKCFYANENSDESSDSTQPRARHSRSKRGRKRQRNQSSEDSSPRRRIKRRRVKRKINYDESDGEVEEMDESDGMKEVSPAMTNGSEQKDVEEEDVDSPNTHNDHHPMNVDVDVHKQCAPDPMVLRMNNWVPYEQILGVSSSMLVLCEDQLLQLNETDLIDTSQSLRQFAQTLPEHHRSVLQQIPEDKQLVVALAWYEQVKMQASQASVSPPNGMSVDSHG